jgi:hypothetical protein
LEGATNTALIEEVMRRDDIELTVEFWDKMEPDEDQISEFLEKHGAPAIDEDVLEFEAVKSSVIVNELARVIYSAQAFDVQVFRELIREYGIYS